MTIDDQIGDTTSSRRVNKRYWRRVDPPAAAWWPWGWLLLLGLLLLYLYGVMITNPTIQSEVRQGVSDNLRQLGVNVTDVDADGQAIRATVVGTSDDVAQMRAMAKGTECMTWAGLLTCPTEVRLDVSAPAEALVPIRGHDFDFVKVGNGITLYGEVPDEQTRRKVEQQARLLFHTVDNQLIVSGEKATDGYLTAAGRALGVLRQLERGSATWTTGLFDVTGLARADVESAVRSSFSSEVGAPRLGKLTLQIAKESDHCNEEFMTALRNSSIKFRTGSATIDESSDVLLTELASLARQCPGSLTIEGHTDDVGLKADNKVLSLNRAEAVLRALVAKGVAAERLSALGFGESQPIADNATPSGRARNRRIAIGITEQE